MGGREYQLAALPRLLAYPYRLYAVGWQPDHLYIHRHTCLERLFICLTFRSEGPSVSIVNGRRQEMQRLPHLSILRPGTRLETIRPARHDELYFSYEEPAASAILALGAEPGGFQLTAAVEEVVAAIRRSLDVLHTRGAADRLDQLAVRLLTECRVVDATPPTDEDGRIGEIAAYFALHFSERIDLEALASKYGMSRRSFYRAWQRHFEDTPAQYLIARRLAFAEELLAESDADIGAVARRSGFGGGAYLIERFRARHGCSPREYRERFRAGEKDGTGIIRNTES